MIGQMIACTKGADRKQSGHMITKKKRSNGSAVQALGIFLVMASSASGSTSDLIQEQPIRLSEKVTIFTPCTQSAAECDTTLLLHGEIDQQAEDELKAGVEAIRATRPGYPIRVAFNSSGGSLISGLRIGAYLRQIRASTYVAPSYAVWWTFSEEIIVDSDAVCYSACFYAFLGGVSRSVDGDGSPPLGVHQFSGVQDGGAAQAITVLLSRYAEALRVDRRAIDLASVVPPGGIRRLTYAEARELSVTNDSPPSSPWLVRADGGDFRIEVEQRRSGIDCILKLVARARRESVVRVDATYGHLASCSPETIEALDGNSNRTPRLNSLEFKPVSPWVFDETRSEISGVFEVSHQQLISMVEKSESHLTFDPGWGNGDYRRAPYVAVSAQGLLDGLTLISAATSND